MESARTRRLATLGSGIGYREELHEQTIRFASSIDCVEIISERYLGEAGPERARALREFFPVIPHGVGLSIATLAESHSDYLRRLRHLCDAIEAPYYSDHLCFTRVPLVDLGHLSPIPYTELYLVNTIREVDIAQDLLGRRLVLENITRMIDFPGSEMSEGEFFTRLTRETGCGLLLDLTNLYTNGVNAGNDPFAMLMDYPLDDVVQVHLAGGHWENDLLVDSHTSLVPETVWQLLTRLAAIRQPCGVIVEQDRQFPPFEQLAAQVEKARAIVWPGIVWPGIASPGRRAADADATSSVPLP